MIRKETHNTAMMLYINLALTSALPFSPTLNMGKSTSCTNSGLSPISSSSSSSLISVGSNTDSHHGASPWNSSETKRESLVGSFRVDVKADSWAGERKDKSSVGVRASIV